MHVDCRGKGGELLHIIKCDALSCQQCALGEQCGSGVVSKQTACITVAVSLNKACIGRLVYLLNYLDLCTLSATRLVSNDTHISLAWFKD